MAEHPELSAQERAGKAFPVSWDQFHRDCRALTWRLNEVGPFHAVIAITRGGLVPAAIVARELGVRVIDTVCIASYDHTKQGDLKVLKGVSADTAKLGGGTGNGLLIVDDLVDTGKTARPKCRRTPGYSFRGILRSRSSRRSATARRDPSCLSPQAGRGSRDSLCRCKTGSFPRETSSRPRIAACSPAIAASFTTPQPGLC